MATQVKLRSLSSLGVACALVSMPLAVSAAPKQGDVLQTDSLSMLLVNRDLTTRTTSSIKNTINLSANVGLHYYFVDRVRIGMSLQATTRLWPEPIDGSSRLQRFAFMPQLGWSFHDPFFVALLFSYAPRTLGRANPDLAVLGAIGAALTITRSTKISLALQVPYSFLHHRAVGLVAVTGVSFLF
jgi:hypothetical protein